MAGGAGDDIYVVDSTSDVVNENSSEGTDLIQSSVTYTAPTNVENITLTGGTALTATGNSANNKLTGNAASSTLIGGSGDDTYVISDATTVITENSSEGTDLIQSSVTYTAPTNIEQLTLTGSSNLNATGNTENNTLTGNSGNNSINGGTGDDTMAGGAGDDIYVVDSTSDVVNENSSEGTDLIQSSVTYTAPTNVENITLTGGTALTATGNSANNKLTGNAASSTLIGGSGDDTYVISDATTVITENSSEGTDLIQSSVTYTAPTNIEQLTLTGSSNLNATGNTANNKLTGNSGNLSLIHI